MRTTYGAAARLAAGGPAAIQPFVLHPSRGPGVTLVAGRWPRPPSSDGRLALTARPMPITIAVVTRPMTVPRTRRRRIRRRSAPMPGTALHRRTHPFGEVLAQVGVAQLFFTHRRPHTR